VNAEVTAVVEKAEERKREEICAECVVIVELGEVSKDTLGDPFGGLHDPGWNRWFF
jgi:hypothetical protein